VTNIVPLAPKSQINSWQLCGFSRILRQSKSTQTHAQRLWLVWRLRFADNWLDFRSVNPKQRETKKDGLFLTGLISSTLSAKRALKSRAFNRCLYQDTLLICNSKNWKRSTLPSLSKIFGLKDRTEELHTRCKHRENIELLFPQRVQGVQD